MNQVIINFKKIIPHRYFPVLALITINLCVGMLIVNDYGESWDEANNRIYAEQSLRAYAWWGNKNIDLEEFLGPTDQRYRGPAYPMLASLLVTLMESPQNDGFSTDLWHFVNFLFFQLGVFFFYIICRRTVKTWGALGATLLFATQPLLWGHAFINSKDIPLLVFFLGSMALGLKMVDSFLVIDNTAQIEGENLVQLIKQDWAVAKSIYRNTFILLSGLLAFLFVFSNTFWNLIVSLITRSYDAEPSSFLGVLFSKVANNIDTVPLEDYIYKVTLYFNWGKIFGNVLLLILLSLVSYHIFRNSLFQFWQRFRLQWSIWFSKWFTLLAAAIILGLAVSTRVSGVLAGILIAIYFLLKARKKSILALITYASVAILATYITWPFLWQNPIGNFLESLTVSSDFGWTGRVLFQGVEYKSFDLPANYLPVLLLLQFTEPVFFLFFGGVILAIPKILKRVAKWDELLLILVWFFIPLMMVIIFKPIMYDNFRHWLFIAPPIFVLAGLALDSLFKRIRLGIVKAGVLLLLLLPGFYWGVVLHPYQYIYYNGFGGGVSGAYRQYELDYWATSYREATLYLNQKAPLNSKVLVVGPRRIFMSYAREDLNQEWFTVDELDETSDPVFVIISTRYNDDLIQFPDAEVVYRVSRDDATLAVVKQIK